MTTNTTPPAGMRFREIEVRILPSYGSSEKHRVLHDGISYVFVAGDSQKRYPYRSVQLMAQQHSACDWTDEVVQQCFALRENNLEPAPPAPVVRDATWEKVREIVEDARENGLALDAATDAILREVRGEQAHVAEVRQPSAVVDTALETGRAWLNAANAMMGACAPDGAVPLDLVAAENDAMLRHKVALRSALDFALPAPLTAADHVAALVGATSKLLRYAERATCTHEETTRQGVIWEVCSGCGRRWADDRGGKPEYKEPAVFEEVRSALALLAPAETRGVE